MPKKIDRNKIKKILPQYIDILEGRDKQIVRMYYGLDGEEKSSYREIGRRLGISGERIRQIEYRAIEKVWNEYLARKEIEKSEKIEGTIEKVSQQEEVKIVSPNANKIIKDISINYKNSLIAITFSDGNTLTYPVDKKLIERIRIEKKSESAWVGGHTM